VNAAQRRKSAERCSKNNCQKGNPMTLKMMPLVAIKGLYCMFMMFLRKNKVVLLFANEEESFKGGP
jgi:hypothetical protein